MAPTKLCSEDRVAMETWGLFLHVVYHSEVISQRSRGWQFLSSVTTSLVDSKSVFYEFFPLSEDRDLLDLLKNCVNPLIFTVAKSSLKTWNLTGESIVRKIFEEEMLINSSNAEATFVQYTRMQKIVKIIQTKSCSVGIHCKALAEYSQMSTHFPGFRLFFVFFLHHVCIEKNSHQQHKC